LPDGVFNILPRYGASTGKALVSYLLIKKVDVIGGTPLGRAIGAVARGNLAKFIAELGGKALVIVTSNANLDLAVNRVAFASFVASGQIYIVATRIIVYYLVIDLFVEKIATKAESISRRIGAPTNLESTIGPIIL